MRLARLTNRMTTTLRPHRSYWQVVAEEVAGREGWAREQGYNPQMVPIEHRVAVFPELAPKPAPKRQRRTSRRSPRPLVLPMRKVESGVYETEGGAYRIIRCTFDRYCDTGGHPMRTGRGRGEWCPGDQWHTPQGWMFRERNTHGVYQDATLSGLDVVDTLREAVEIVSGYLR